MTAGERANRAAMETPQHRARRKLFKNWNLANVFLLLGNISHWLKEAGISDLFAIGTVFLVPIGLLYMGAALYWTSKHLYLTWKEE